MTKVMIMRFRDKDIDPKRTITDWRKEAEDAASSLVAFLDYLRDWEKFGGELLEGEFNEAADALHQAGLWPWVESVDVAGGIDALGAAVKQPLSKR